MHTGNYFYELSNDVGRSHSILFDCIESPTYEDYALNGETVGCGNKLASIVIFYSFWIFVTLIFLNLFIAIILQGYSESVIRSGKFFNYELPNKFVDVWS